MDNRRPMMKTIKQQIKEHWVLLLALGLTVLFCSFGINWSRYEDWNPDQMAFKNIFIIGQQSFNPKYFLVPPFYTYFIYFIDLKPLAWIAELSHLDKSTLLML